MPTKYPPAWSLSQCIKASKEIYKVHADEKFNIELLVDFLDTSKTSSYFNRRTSALQGFGLLNRSDQTVQLTDLAVQIVAPVAGEDRNARLIAFRKVDVLSQLLPRYPNGKLPPEPETLKSVLLQSINIDRETIPQWYDFAVNSFMAISGIDNTQMNGQLSGKKQQDDEPEMRTSTVYLPSGRKFSFSVESDYTQEDRDFVHNLLALFLKATPKEKEKASHENN